jgi:hypothetical protein
LFVISGWLFQPMREKDRGAQSRIVMPYTAFRCGPGIDGGARQRSRAGGVRDKHLGEVWEMPVP